MNPIKYWHKMRQRIVYTLKYCAITLICVQEYKCTICMFLLCELELFSLIMWWWSCGTDVVSEKNGLQPSMMHLRFIRNRREKKIFKSKQYTVQIDWLNWTTGDPLRLNSESLLSGNFAEFQLSTITSWGDLVFIMWNNSSRLKVLLSQLIPERFKANPVY